MNVYLQAKLEVVVIACRIEINQSVEIRIQLLLNTTAIVKE